MKQIIINIARDFSRYPAGRFPSDGPFNGTLFRKKFLIPSLSQQDRVIVELDGVRGLGSSFLEEAFGGLLRAGVTIDTINTKLKFVASDQSLIDEIQGYMREQAETRS